MTDAASLIVWALVTAAVAAALAWAASRRSRAALSRLRDISRAIAAGDLDARAPLSGPREVSDAGIALRAIAEQLETGRHAIEERDALLAGLLESLNEGVVVVDSSQRVVQLNKAAQDLFDVTESTPFPVALLPRAAVLHEALRTALGGGDTARTETEVRGRQVSLTARALPGGGAILAALDLSPMRKLETVRRDFVANVSHELRTPLTVVRGFAETLAAEDVDAATTREFSAKIKTSTERMQRIVDDLLDLSRMESGGWIPTPTLIELRPLAADVLAQARGRAREKVLSLNVDIPEGAAKVFADRVALVQTLMNLVENAVRHTDAGSVTLFAEPATNGVTLGVRDTGRGIPSEHLPRIFERFYRADPGRARDSGGTGLGLAIVKHLVEAHGGHVHAESAVGSGTTVRAFFPGRAPA